jgi:hypothetical protein
VQQDQARLRGPKFNLGAGWLTVTVTVSDDCVT